MAETGEGTVMQRIVGIIRDALRRLNVRLKWTDTDIRNLIRKGWRYSEGGKGFVRNGRGGETSFLLGGTKAKRPWNSSIAQTMTEEGKSKEEIWKETGRIKGVDGKWRFLRSMIAQRACGR
jgi:hypothetical protein